jgi:phosphoglycolate phosphatase-like HAD superfamily hydrolase
MPDPLASWKTGPVKSAILDFVDRVTLPESPDFVRLSERIAVFDNDGTLWCEQPLQVQVFFAQDRLKALAMRDPELKTQQPFKAFLEHDLKAMHDLGKRGVFAVAFMVHAGVTDTEFSEVASTWLASAAHPMLGRRFTQCVFRPQLELMDYLRDNGFKTFIVSGGGVDFIRTFAEDVYGIPSDQIIGSSVKTRVDIHDEHMDLLKLAELGTFNDRDVKVENIGLHIGRRPILAFGNSDGDLSMLRYTKAGDGPRLALLLHHDDADREFAYDREFRLSPLAEALDHAGDYGITVVSMKHDWENIFADPSVRPSAVASGVRDGGLAGRSHESGDPYH